jgi:uncharacterized protein (DUF2384 family)
VAGSEEALVDLAYKQIVNGIRSASLTAAELAEIVGVRERQIQHWAAGVHKPQGEARDRLLEVRYIVDQLRDVYTPEGIDIWLHGRNRSLEGRRPIDLLRTGDFRTVLAAIERLQAGAM